MQINGSNGFAIPISGLNFSDYTGVQPNGYVDPNSGEFVVVKEACAELVVPDLTDFKLRPYVSFKTDVRIEERFLSLLSEFIYS